LISTFSSSDFIAIVVWLEWNTIRVVKVRSLEKIV